MASKPRIYIDSCCFIDAVKQAVGTLPTDRNSDAWFTKKLLEAHRGGDIIVHTSLVTVGECLSIEPGQAQVSKDVQEHFRQLLTSGQYVHLVAPTPKTSLLIQSFRWDHGLVLSSPDALHFASALESGCVEFLTTDDRLQKPKIMAASTKLSAMGIRLVRASATAQLPDEYRQGVLGEGSDS